jgi:ADP-ribose pyrophosphatase YjhB (NUDIX family)
MKFGLSNKKIRIRVAGLVVEENKILLIAHKKGNEIYWLLPGGGVEYQESLDEALKREFFEEYSRSW